MNPTEPQMRTRPYLGLPAPSTDCDTDSQSGKDAEKTVEAATVNATSRGKGKAEWERKRVQYRAHAACNDTRPNQHVLTRLTTMLVGGLGVD